MDNQQALFFQAIKSALPDYQNLALSVAEELGISTNEAYKKIRGDSNLTFQQIIKLSDCFDVPFLYSPKQSLSVTFSYLSVNEDLDMVNYLRNLLDNIKAIKNSKEKHITITTDDIPVFHFSNTLNSPVLNCFSGQTAPITWRYPLILPFFLMKLLKFRKRCMPLI